MRSLPAACMVGTSFDKNGMPQSHRLPLRSLTMAVLLACAVGGCNREGQGPLGIIIDTDGSTLSTRYPENIRRVHEHRIDDRLLQDEALSDAVESGWRFTTSITEDPIYDRDVDDGSWSYPQATVTVMAHPPADRPTATPPREAITATVDRFFRFLADKGDVALTIQAAPLQNQAATPPTSELPPTVPGQDDPTVGRYVIQAGDTLAQISAVFYGNMKHWRSILEANPGLEATDLQAGQEIVIPELP